MIVVVLLLIGIMWYISSSYYTDNIKVNIADTDAKLLNDWFTHELHCSSELSTEFNTDANLSAQTQIAAATLLKVLYDVNIDATNIIVGLNIDKKYYKLTGKNLVPNRTLFDLRDVLGLSLQICIVNARLYQKLTQDHNSQVNEHQLRLLIAIIEDKAYDLVLSYIKKVLDHRWNKLQELQDERIINNSGSYLYLRSDNEQILPNITGLLLSKEQVRINLLCTEYEFDLLLKRWRVYMKNNIISATSSAY